MPAEVAVKSGKKVWWKCSKCSHEWQAVIVDRVNGRGCPVCAGRVTKKGYNDLATQYPNLADEWHYGKNSIKPTDITPGSHKKVWWLGKCGHEWQAMIPSRVQGCGCAVCAGKIILEGFNDLATKRPELLDEWNYSKNVIKPTEIGGSSGKKVWWKCEKGHEWQAAVYSRANNGCPICAGKRIKNE